MSGKKRFRQSISTSDVEKEWNDDTLCSICMEHPHNAVLLLCTSHAKGCRSYICNTTRRLSNCLDRFTKFQSQENLPGKESLKCPHCRGDVLAWTVVEEARSYLNKKRRSCTLESCTFVGNYFKLRRHAKRVHPKVRPAAVDKSRQEAWEQAETQRALEDVLDALRSEIPGAVVIGDFIVEARDAAQARRYAARFLVHRLR